jgi:uncharacterized protein
VGVGELGVRGTAGTTPRFCNTIAFIFADLITLPLVLIYRKFYGTRMALRLFGVFWLVMSGAGLITEYLFTAAHLVPASDPTTTVPTGVHWDYTTILNIIALIVFGGIFWLHRNRTRLGAGAGYATDVVCGMQVEKTDAPAISEHHGRPFFFCSDRCRERFTSDPEKFARGAATEPMNRDTADGCAVDPQQADSATYAGRTYHFCVPGCRDTFTADLHAHQ